MARLKNPDRPRGEPATVDELVGRLTALADNASRAGYPFTAEHLKQLATNFIRTEHLASAAIAGNVVRQLLAPRNR